MPPIETAIQVALAWIGICGAACIMALAVLWIGFRMFGDMAGDSGSSNDIDSLKDSIRGMKNRIHALEMKVERMNKEED